MVVVVTNARWVLLLALAGHLIHATAGVLPEDRADALYHTYDGGDVEITGPSILIRKGDGKSLSLSGNYYVDTVSSASVDVVTQGSKYSESRTQLSTSIDYLHADTIMSLGYTNSDEDDYKAESVGFSLSQSMFGDLTNVTLGYTKGWADVFRNGDANFEDTTDQQRYRVSLSQVLTKNAILSLNYEAITDEGFLNNPYRSVRFVDNSVPLGYSFQAELYPSTRTSNAVMAGLKYYLPYRAALHGSYRYFVDDWNITAHNAELSYIHPLFDHWIVEVGYRYYTQTEADFYNDLFPFQDATNFRARDKELSEFNDHTLNIAVQYELLNKGWHFIDRATVHLKFSHIWFQYDNYTDISQGGPVGGEPNHSFEANVVRAFFSAYF